MASNDFDKLNERENFIKKNFIDSAGQNAQYSLDAYKSWFLPQLEVCLNLVSEHQLIKKEYDKVHSEEYSQNYPFKGIAKPGKTLCQDIDLTYLRTFSSPKQLSIFLLHRMALLLEVNRQELC